MDQIRSPTCKLFFHTAVENKDEVEEVIFQYFNFVFPFSVSHFVLLAQFLKIADRGANQRSAAIFY